MSPEQLAGKKIDGRSDLFSLGVTLYQMLSRRAAVRGRVDGAADVQDRQRAAARHPVFRPDMPERLADVVARALAKQPDERYQDGEEMAADLRSVLAELPARLAHLLPLPQRCGTSAVRLRRKPDAKSSHRPW